MTMRPLIILGCGGLGRSVASLVDQINAASSDGPRWDLLGFLDDAPSHEDVRRVHDRGSRVLGPVAAGDFEPGSVAYVCAVGNGKVREQLCRKADAAGLTPATLVHHRANIGANVSLGAGTVVCAGATIDPDVTVGRHVVINKNSITGHDNDLQDFVTLGPLSVVGGGGFVGTRATFGMHAMTIPGVRVGADAVLGAAACAVRDVPTGATVKGVPAA